MSWLPWYTIAIFSFTLLHQSLAQVCSCHDTCKPVRSYVVYYNFTTIKSQVTATFENCENLCAENAKCEVYKFNTNTKACTLMYDGNYDTRSQNMDNVTKYGYCTRKLCTGDLNPCENGGECKNETENCECKPGFTGAKCETDSCACQHGGNCVSKDGKWTCDCAGTGYEGNKCQSDINECKSNPCKNGGTCTNGVNLFTCKCPPGYTGKRCETDINECKSNPCKNGGTCRDGANSYVCKCPPGYTGKRCETDINECKSNPCKNGGTCTDGVNSYVCKCLPGYTGKQCETDIDECNPNPCKNRGHCTHGINKYSCNCTGTGFTGKNCSEDFNECGSNPCQNGGWCNNEDNKFSCECTSNFAGTMCQYAVQGGLVFSIVPNHKIAGVPVFTLYDANWDQCSLTCFNNEGLSAFDFNRATSACALYDNIHRLSEARGTDVGVIAAAGAEYQYICDHDPVHPDHLFGYYNGFDYTSNCQDLCDVTPGCKYFTHDKANWVCGLGNSTSPLAGQLQAVKRWTSDRTCDTTGTFLDRHRIFCRFKWPKTNKNHFDPKADKRGLKDPHAVVDDSIECGWGTASVNHRTLAVDITPDFSQVTIEMNIPGKKKHNIGGDLFVQLEQIPYEVINVTELRDRSFINSVTTFSNKIRYSWLKCYYGQGNKANEVVKRVVSCWESFCEIGYYGRNITSPKSYYARCGNNFVYPCDSAKSKEEIPLDNGETLVQTCCNTDLCNYI